MAIPEALVITGIVHWSKRGEIKVKRTLSFSMEPTFLLQVETRVLTLSLGNLGFGGVGRRNSPTLNVSKGLWEKEIIN